MQKPLKPPALIDPFKTYVTETRRLPFEASVGSIASEPVSIYPPGTNEINQGEIIKNSNVEKVIDARALGQTIVGLNEDGTIDVVASPDPLDRYRFEVHHTPDCSAQIILQFANAYAPAYCSETYGQFAFYEQQAIEAMKNRQPVDALAPSQCPGVKLEPKKHYTLYELDIDLPTGFARWVSPERCREVIADRCRDPGYIILVRDRIDDNIVGFLHVRVVTAERHARTEENGNQILFSNLSLANYPELQEAINVSHNHYLEELKYHTGIEPDQDIITISAQWVHPDCRGGGGVFYHMMHLAANAINERSWDYLPYLAEIPSEDGGTPHIVNSATADHLIFGLLTNGDAMAYSEQAKNSLIYFISADQSRWKYAVKNRAKELKTRYRPHPTDSPKVEIRSAGNKGQGVFAKEMINKGERLAEFVGRKYRAARATDLPAEAVNTAIQISGCEYVHNYLGLAEKFNHACGATNCYIHGTTEIRAAREIAPGEELCWPYPTSECSTWHLDNCLCGNPDCLGEVVPFQDLPSEWQKFYIEKGYASRHVQETYRPLHKL